MMPRPRIIDYVLLGLAVLCFICPTLYLILKYPSLPEQIPTHFGPGGEVDAWGARGAAAAMPVFAFIMLVITVPICFAPGMWNTTWGVPAAKLPQAVRTTRTMLCALAFLVQALFGYMTVCVARCSAMKSALLWTITALVFITLAVGVVSLLRLKKK